ncbi:MAG: GntR family transcriptional regulator [Bryobacterales bacterium]
MPSGRAASFSSQESTSLAQYAYSAIRDRILKGELKLGAPISRRKLAAGLGMSLLPVAEALQRLEGEGLVESRPRIGTRVCEPNADDIRQRYEIREALETQAARLFSQNASLEERQELKKTAKEMDELFNRYFNSQTDPESLYAIHNYHAQLHRRIAECSGCRLLCQALERNHVMVFNWLYDVAAERPPLPPRFHRELIEALSEGDPEVADRAMRRHVRYGLENILRGINHQNGWQAGDGIPREKASKRRTSAASNFRKSKRAS